MQQQVERAFEIFQTDFVAAALSVPFELRFQPVGFP